MLAMGMLLETGRFMPQSGSSPAKGSRDNVERVRAQLVAAMHLGRLRPGDRVPSVRRLADLTGMDRKTVHRAYVRLAREGLLDLRAGSGTYLAGGHAAEDARPALSDLVGVVNRSRTEAAALGVSTAIYARFLELSLCGGLRDVTLTVVECNLEQVGVFGHELRASTGVRWRPALVADLKATPRELVGDSFGIVTTDFHAAEVGEIGASLGLPVYRVTLEASFPKTLVDHARRGDVVMVVRDKTFATGFLRFLAQIPVPEEILSRFVVVEPMEAAPALRATASGASVYISPLVERAMAGKVPSRLIRVPIRRHLASASVERLRARLAFDKAVREAGVRLDGEHGTGEP